MASRILRNPALQLFLALLASQAALSTLSPLLGEMARDLDSTPAVLGQLRSVSGLCAGAGAIWLASSRSPRVDLRTVIFIGLGLLAGGVLVTAIAPTLPVLVVAQVPVGLGVAFTVTGGTAAAGEWPPPDERPGVLAWALAGQPAAWVVGLPLVGLAAAVDWRLSWLVVPFTGSLLAAAVLATRPGGRTDHPDIRLRDLLSIPGVAAWTLGELLAYSAWAGVLVYAGALFIESYGVSVGAASYLLAGGAAAYAAGNLTLRRWVGASSSVLIGLGLAAAVGTAALGAVRPHPGVSFVVFALLAYVAAGRALGGAVFGLRLVPGIGGMSLRTASLQLGYLAGSTVGGLAMALGGYPALGITLGSLFVPAVIPYVVVPRLRGREVPPEEPAPAASAVAICP